MHFPLVARRRRSTRNDIVRSGIGRSFSILSFELSLLLAIASLLVGGRSLGLQEHTKTKQTHAEATIRRHTIYRGHSRMRSHRGTAHLTCGRTFATMAARGGAWSLSLRAFFVLHTRIRIRTEHRAQSTGNEQRAHASDRRSVPFALHACAADPTRTRPACAALHTDPILFILSIHSGTSLPDCCTNLATEWSRGWRGGGGGGRAGREANQAESCERKQRKMKGVR